MPPQQPSMMPVALAIGFAGIVIALSIYLVLKPTSTSYVNGADIEVAEVTASDHILGDPNAPIKVIEYSDLDCPYCRAFHATMKAIMSVYGSTGQVAWVYRHFPMVELHPNAPLLAEASECVAEIGGNDAFWRFVDGVFTSPTINDRFDMSKLDATAALSGVPVAAFRTCLDSGKHKPLIAEHFDQAEDAGAQGTPHNLIISPNNDPVPVAGAQPYATIKSILDTLLAN